MPQQEVKAAGYLIFCRKPTLGFLLMKHPTRWDLPKGRLDRGESIEQAALRELWEETGFRPEEILHEREFRFVHGYDLPSKNESKSNPVTRKKELTIFLGWLDEARPPILTEHEGYAWFNWAPPHSIQAKTIDPLLRHVESYFQQKLLQTP